MENRKNDWIRTDIFEEGEDISKQTEADVTFIKRRAKRRRI